MIEIQVCESIDRGHAAHGDPPIYHVEFRFIPKAGGSAIYFQGTCYREREKAEAEKTYVESVFSRAVLKKPKPVKERTRTKRVKRSARR